jgi:2-dehydropantoate 2-reductase
MRILVLGAGALGGYFGAKLLHGGADVTFMVRPRRAAQLARHGLVLKAHEGETRTIVKTVQAGGIAGPCDVVLLCCKSYDLPGAMAAIAPVVGPGTAVLPLLNGVRHIDMLCERFGAAHVLGGLTAVNASLGPEGEVVQSPVKVDMTAFGELDGSRSARCLAIERAYAAAGMKSSISETIVASMWAKFVAFCAVASISTLCRSRAGGIAGAAASGAFVAAATNECYRVAAALGYSVPDPFREVIRNLFADQASQYGPSILIDMEQGRPTEVEHTIGDMVQRATSAGVDAPILTAALCNLQICESERQLRAAQAAN